MIPQFMSPRFRFSFPFFTFIALRLIRWRSNKNNNLLALVVSFLLSCKNPSQSGIVAWIWRNFVKWICITQSEMLPDIHKQGWCRTEKKQGTLSKRNKKGIAGKWTNLKWLLWGNSRRSEFHCMINCFFILFIVMQYFCSLSETKRKGHLSQMAYWIFHELFLLSEIILKCFSKVRKNFSSTSCFIKPLWDHTNLMSF